MGVVCCWEREGVRYGRVPYWSRRWRKDASCSLANPSPKNTTINSTSIHSLTFTSDPLLLLFTSLFGHRLRGHIRWTQAIARCTRAASDSSTRTRYGGGTLPPASPTASRLSCSDPPAQLLQALAVTCWHKYTPVHPVICCTARDLTGPGPSPLHLDCCIASCSHPHGHFPDHSPVLCLAPTLRVSLSRHGKAER